MWKPLVHIAESEKEACILPLKTLSVKTDAPAIQSFLIPRVLEKFKEKKGVDHVTEKNGFLRAIEVEGKLTLDDKKRLSGAVTWALTVTSSK